MTREEKSRIILQMTPLFDAASIRLETEHLLLHPVDQMDLRDIHEIVSDPSVAATGGFSLTYSQEETAERMLEYMDDNETLGVVLKSSGKLIGTVSLQKRDWTAYPISRELRGREFGFDLNRNYWGMGLMPEAVRSVSDYCFRVLNYDFLTAGHFLENPQSERVIHKCGFSYLFEAEHENPGKWKKMIRTWIQYNPQKEI